MFNSSAISQQINESIQSKNNNNNNISINNNNNNNSNSNNSNDSNIDNNDNKDNKMVEMVYSLLEMLRLSSAEEMSTKLLLMSQSPQICVQMRQLGCLSLLIQLLHQQNDDQIECNDRQKLLLSHEMRQKANKTLRNIIINSAKSKRELRILRLIEDLRSFVDLLRLRGHELCNDVVDHPSSSVAHLLKVSFDEQHRQVIGLLGGVYAIAQVSDH
jgi:adenomatosis polyposis coli protein